MDLNRHSTPRRQFIRGAGFGAAAFFVTPGLFAEELMRTAAMTEGPFYPDRMPQDTDNDLLVLNDSLTPAVGEITYLSGRVLGKDGEPVRNALVEIWQVDHKGAYIHSESVRIVREISVRYLFCKAPFGPLRGKRYRTLISRSLLNSDKRDTNFQGYGRFLTDIEGRYFFRTVKPVPYPGRAPHIHFAISRGGKRVLTTQLLVAEDALNEKDGLLRRLGDDKVKQTVLTEFKPMPDSKIGELVANWNIVLGVTASDA